MTAPRPPLGLRPARVAAGYPRNLRIHEIACAVLRYAVADMHIPIEWADELASLTDPARDLPNINTSRHNGPHSWSDARECTIREAAQREARAEVQQELGDAQREVREAREIRAAWAARPWWRRAYDAIWHPETVL